VCALEYIAPSSFELQFATNHLGHFQLTLLLKPALVKANGARVVSVASWGHRRSPVVFDDINFEHRPYDPMLAYGQSKTANVLFALGLDQRWRSEHIRAFSVHPGMIVTNLGNENPNLPAVLKSIGMFDEEGKPVLDPDRQLKTVGQGASTNVFAAVSPKLNGLGGLYLENNEVTYTLPDDNVKPPLLGLYTHARNIAAAKQLWDLSEHVVFGK